MNKILILIPVFSLFLLSCGNAPKQKNKEKTEADAIGNHQHNDESEAIELNNGEKWAVDSNMITHIRNMENEINSFENAQQKDYKVLADQLQGSIDLLTSNCTMKGKAHDELHKWLLPYIEMVQLLTKAKNDVEAAKQFENIQNSFITFNQYFL